MLICALKLLELTTFKPLEMRSMLNLTLKITDGLVLKLAIQDSFVRTRVQGAP
jgi:hypothetical protein